jgi:regulation of enolase protein 1 (concanavalin A-like superfamily)
MQEEVLDKKLIFLKKGKHWFQPINLKTLNGETTVKFSFTDSMKVDSMHINKMFGLSSTLNVHGRSIRLGWRYEKLIDKFRIFSYVYRDGVRDLEMVEPVLVSANEELTVRLYSSKETFSVTLYKEEDTLMSILLYRKANKKKAYLPCIVTHPYWGGTESSPSDMSFHRYGFNKSRFIKNLNVLYKDSPIAVGGVIMLLAFFFTIGIGLISPVLIFLFIRLGILYYLLFVNQWIYTTLSKFLQKIM